MSGAAPTPHHLAHRLLALGLSVFPIPRPRPGVPPNTPGDGKTPALKWKPYQTCLPTVQEIDDWFGGTPMNLAVVTGAISGVVVIDLDSPEALQWGVRRFPYTPWQTETARGFHLWYRHAGVPVPNGAHLDTCDGRLALDVRGDGGYVIAPGSIHASGVEYREAGDWREPRARVPVFWPGWLQRAPRRQDTARRRMAEHPRNAALVSGDSIIARARAYLAAIPRPEIGQGSDVAVLSAACRVVRGFALSSADAEALLWEWAGGRAGWTREWVAQKVAHAERYGSEPYGALR